MKTKFYEFAQNNSGGHFDVDENICHRIIIEAENEQNAIEKAEQLGCYWNGVEKGLDCPCCGDRWYSSPIEIDIDQFKKEGYPIEVYSIHDNAEEKWFSLFGEFPRIEEPKWCKQYGSEKYVGIIYFENIEQYCQFLANEYGWTTPDIRIYYADGRKIDIFQKII